MNLMKTLNFPKWKRAYVFVKVAESYDPGTVAVNILNINQRFDSNMGFIIRADTVETPLEYQIVVTVNAKTDQNPDEDQYGQILTELRKIDAEAVEAIVSENTHYPDPPHLAGGYVSSDESNQDPIGGPGTTGHNVWG